MPTHDPEKSVHSADANDRHEQQAVDASKGYEASDVNTSGTFKVLVGFVLFGVLSGVAAWGTGKLINTLLAREDGPPSRWSHPTGLQSKEALPSNAELQNKTGPAIQRYPTPRLQTDDGLRDLVELHAREDLLLDNYSWVDPQHTKLRIPITRAMELIAQSGLPLAHAVPQETQMTGDATLGVTAPLTNGFARTGFEQEESQQQALKDKTTEAHQ